MHGLPNIITDLTFITIYAGIITLLFKWLKQPVVLGYVLAGVVAGPYFNLFPTVKDMDNISIWADVGVIFLLFNLGLEFSFKKILDVGKAAIITGFSNILIMLFLGYNLGLMLGWTTTDSLFLGGMLSMSSTTIIIKAFEELNLRKEKFTDLVFGVLIIEDIVGVLLLVLLPAITLGNSADSSQVNPTQLLISAAKLVSFLVCYFIFGIYLIPTLLKKIKIYLNDEMLLIISVALCFSLVLLATNAGFSSALGAFLMGAILASTSLTERIEHVLKPLKDFFGAVFFVSVGMLVNPEMFIEYAGTILCISILVLLAISLSSCCGFLLSGQPLKTAIQGGFSLAQVGEFAFIIASLGMSIGVLSPQVYPIIVAVSVLTTFTTPMMMKSAVPFSNWLLRVLPQPLLDFLHNNTSAKKLTNSEQKLWQELFKNYFIRLGVFSILIIAIMNLSLYVVQPYFTNFIPGYQGKVLLTVLTLMVMAPFLHALLVSKRKIINLYLNLWLKNRTNFFPLILLTSFRILLVVFFIMVVIHQLLTSDPYITVILAIGAIFALSRSRWVFTQYMKMETQFFDNLNKKTK